MLSIAASSENVSDAQVKSQIKALNDDFRAKNADKSKVPAVWKGLVTDSKIQFALATKDPARQEDQRDHAHGHHRQVLRPRRHGQVEADGRGQPVADRTAT